MGLNKLEVFNRQPHVELTEPRGHVLAASNVVGTNGRLRLGFDWRTGTFQVGELPILHR